MSEEQVARISPLVCTVMQFVQMFEDGDSALIREASRQTNEARRRREAAFPVIVACGGRYDPEADALEARSAELLAELIETRQKLRKAVEDQANKKARQDEILRAMGL